MNANWTAHSAFFKGTLKAGFDTSNVFQEDARDENVCGTFFFFCEHLQNVYLLQFFILCIIYIKFCSISANMAVNCI